MPYVQIKDFRLGRDTRRVALSAPPGSLVLCENCHINSGGEIEKRKAFVLLASLAVAEAGTHATANVSATHGLLPLSSTLAVFGSAAATSGAAINSEPYLATAIPATTPAVGYVQLRHPAVSDGATYDKTKHRMTALLAAEAFGGASWAAARFEDGSAYAYYDGEIIPAWRNGIILDGLTTPNAIASQLRAALTEELGGGYTIEGTNEYADIKGPAGTVNNFSLNFTPDSTAGTLAVVQQSTGSDGTPGVGASLLINFTTWDSGITIDSITAPTGVGSNTVDILGGQAVAYSVSLNNSVALLAQRINAVVTSPKYTATANAGALTLACAASAGDTVNAKAVTVNYSGTGTLALNSTGTVALTVQVSSTVAAFGVYSDTSVQVITDNVMATPSGGTGPYTYLWEEYGTSSGITITAPSNATTAWKKVVASATAVSGTFRCKVTDSGAPPAQVAYSPIVSVTLAVWPMEDLGGGGGRYEP
jgi:hypothetical protein